MQDERDNSEDLNDEEIETRIVRARHAVPLLISDTLPKVVWPQVHLLRRRIVLPLDMTYVMTYLDGGSQHYIEVQHAYFNSHRSAVKTLPFNR